MMSTRQHGTSVARPAGDFPEGVELKRGQTLLEACQGLLQFEPLLPLGVWICDPGGILLYLSPAYRSLSGASADGMPAFSRLDPPDSDPSALADWMERMRSAGPAEMETAFRDAGGARRFVVRRGSPVRDSGRRIHGFAGIHLDVTELRLKEEELDMARRGQDALLEHIRDAICVLGPTGRMLFGNGAAAKLLGLERGNQLAELAPGRLPPGVRLMDREGRPLAWRDLPSFRALRGERPPPGLLRLRRSGGEDAWLEVQALPVFKDGREVSMVVIAAHDVTSLKRAEQALKSANGSLGLIYANVSDFIMLLGLEGEDGYRVLRVNRAAHYFRMSRKEDIEGRLLEELAVEPLLSFYRARCREVREKRESLTFEYEMSLGAGFRLVEARYTPIFEEEERCTHILVVARDVQEQKQNEAKIRLLNRELARRVKELQTILDTAPVGIALAKDPGCRFIKVNAPLAAMLGIDADANASLEAPAGERPGYRFYKQGRELPPHELPLERCAAEGRILRDEELEVALSDGRRVHLSCSTAPVRDDKGAVRGAVGIFLDCTDRRLQAETLRDSEEKLKQSQKMEAVGRLAGGIAHDFNNLLTAINGYADLLLNRLGPDHDNRSYAEEIKKSGDRAAWLTQQLLAYSRQQVLAPRKVDLNTVVQNMDRMLKRLIGDDIHLVTLTPGRPTYVKADPGQVEQVILNLALNARDAMPEGGELTLKVTHEQEAPERPGGENAAGSGILWVSDTGEGMDENLRRRIFEPFFTTKQLGKGTGLGLSVVEGVVKQSGGHIEVESRPGKGSTFRVQFPAFDEHEQGQETAAGPGTDKMPVVGQGTVLLVEDEHTVREFVARVLAVGGYTVLKAASGAEALLLSERHGDGIDMLLTDVVMPEMTGPKLAERIASLRPGMHVVYMSGYTDESITKFGILEEGFHFLQKPFTPGHLLRKLREVLESARAAHDGTGP